LHLADEFGGAGILIDAGVNLLVQSWLRGLDELLNLKLSEMLTWSKLGVWAS
jgi:hypothetical protein